jgi:hypothetical protein
MPLSFPIARGVVLERLARTICIAKPTYPQKSQYSLLPIRGLPFRGYLEVGGSVWMPQNAACEASAQARPPKITSMSPHAAIRVKIPEPRPDQNDPVLARDGSDLPISVENFVELPQG